MRKVLITGGAGFIGSHTADRLLAKNIAVRVLDDLSSGRRDNLPVAHSQLEFIEGDVRNADTVSAAMRGISHCLHLAAQVSATRSLHDPRASAERNVLGFLTVLEAAREARVQRFVYASSAAVYGEPTVLPLTEDVTLKPLSPYGLEKLINEHYGDLYHRLHDFSLMGLRYFNVFGPRQDRKSPYAGVIALFAEQIRSGDTLQVFGDGYQTRDFIFVDDVARANVAALVTQATEVCNVATGRSVTLLDLINDLSSLSGMHPDIRFLPPREGDIQRSAADPTRMHELLGIKAQIGLVDGLKALRIFH
jgi:UDP-glucose 4-epimerase